MTKTQKLQYMLVCCAQCPKRQGYFPTSKFLKGVFFHFQSHNRSISFPFHSKVYSPICKLPAKVAFHCKVLKGCSPFCKLPTVFYFSICNHYYIMHMCQGCGLLMCVLIALAKLPAIISIKLELLREEEEIAKTFFLLYKGQGGPFSYKSNCHQQVH